MSHRFYVPPECFSDGEINFTTEQRNQIKNVLRLKPGSHVTVFDGSGRAFATIIDSAEHGTVQEISTPNVESKLHLTLVQSLPKGDKIELSLQKCTEIGVSEFIIAETSRTIPKIDAKKLPGRLHRWRSIVTEAAEQSGRVRVPKVSGILPFKEALKLTSDRTLRIMPWECEPDRLFSTMLRKMEAAETMVIFIGPEGGFSDEEAAAAQESGATTVSLGPRILRTETAAIVASTLALHSI